MTRSTFLWAGIAALALAGNLPAQRFEDPRDIREAAKQLEREIKDFNNQFDRELDKSFYDELGLKERLDRRSEKLKGELDSFHGKVKSSNDKKARKKLDRALQLAHDIDLTMRERRFSEDLEQHWKLVRFELNRMASYFALSPLGT